MDIYVHLSRNSNKQLLLLHQSSQDFFKNQVQADLAAPLDESNNARSEMAGECETPMSEETQNAGAYLESMGFTDRAKNLESSCRSIIRW